MEISHPLITKNAKTLEYNACLVANLHNLHFIFAYILYNSLQYELHALLEK